MYYYNNLRCGVQEPAVKFKLHNVLLLSEASTSNASASVNLKHSDFENDSNSTLCNLNMISEYKTIPDGK